VNQNDLNDIGARIAEAAAQYAPAHRPTAAQMADAASVLRDMIQSVRLHGVTFADFDSVADFARLAIQLVKSRDESR
jgi:hypothetical protein